MKRSPPALAFVLRLIAAAAFVASVTILGAVLWLRAAPLLQVQLPLPDQSVGHEGLELLVRFPGSGRAQGATFRALLNGADVTESLDTADNGAHGRLQGLLDGENVLRLEIFGRAPGPLGLLWEEVREIRIFFQRPVSVDRA